MWRKSCEKFKRGVSQKATTILHTCHSHDLSSDLFCFVPYLAILSALAPKTTHMFHHTGKRQSTPNCPVLLVANFNPGTGSQSYSSSGKKCARPSHYRLPFFLKDMGPRYNAISVAAHEARPGHHTQVDYWILSIASLISVVGDYLSPHAVFLSRYFCFSDRFSLK